MAKNDTCGGDGKLTETELLDFEITKLRLRTKALEIKIKGLIKYTEYLAENLNASVNYAEFLSGTIADFWSFNFLGDFTSTSNERPPTFDEFKNAHRRKDTGQDKIPF